MVRELLDGALSWGQPITTLHHRRHVLAKLAVVRVTTVGEDGTCSHHRNWIASLTVALGGRIASGDAPRGQVLVWCATGAVRGYKGLTGTCV